MKLFVHGFWKGFIEKTDPIHIDFFIDLFQKVFNENIILSDNIESSDILLESLFTTYTNLFNKKWKYTFLFSGESRLNQFADSYDCVLSGLTDINKKNRIIVPFFILNIYCGNLLERFNKITKPKTKDICCVISNSNSSDRCLYLDILDKYFQIDYFGDYKNNKPKITDNYNSEKFIDIISDYKFIVTMENSRESYYITEKILQGFLSSSIPIYWGSKNIHKYFNTNRFINIDEMNQENIQSSINLITELLNNENKYNQMISENIFLNDNIQHSTYINNIVFDIQKLFNINTRKLILRVVGGFGNQLFMLFNAISLCIDYNLELIVDTNCFDNNRPKFTSYNFFNSVNIKNKLVTNTDLENIQTIYQDGFLYKKITLDCNNSYLLNECYSGYFQSYKFFFHNINKIKKYLNFNNNLIENFKLQLKKYPKHIAIHIRLTDYMTNKDLHQVVDINYYKNILSKYNLDQYKIIIFSDDVELAIKTLNQIIPVDNIILANSISSNDEEQLFLLACTNIRICPNSSYSLWSCYINDIYQINSNALYYFPSKWFGNAFNQEYKMEDLIPTNNFRYKIVNENSQIKNLNDIQNIIYINLSSRPDRKKQLEEELEKINLKQKAKRFNAIQKENGIIGCALSHLMCLEIAIKYDYEHVLILEDDIVFLDPNTFVEQFNKFVNLNIHWDVILFGGNNQDNYKNINNTAIKVKKCFCALGYLVNGKEYMKKIIEAYKISINNHKPIDTWSLWELQEKDDWYLIYPLTVTQRPGHSNIINEFVNYDDDMLVLKYDEEK